MTISPFFILNSVMTLACATLITALLNGGVMMPAALDLGTMGKAMVVGTATLFLMPPVMALELLAQSVFHRFKR